MKPLTLVILSLLFITFTANAQNIIKKTPKLKYTKQLTVEVGGEIFLSSTNGTRTEFGNERGYGTETFFTLKAGAGIFVINGLKLGIEPAVSIHFYDSDNRWTQLKLYFTPEYVLNTKTIVFPYLGASIGYTSSNYSYSVGSSPNMDGIGYGAKAGLRVNLFGNSLLNFGFAYNRENYNYTASYGDVKQRYDVFGMTLGWSVFF